ncbi:hypothetical protein DXG01_001864 [Tephrocybe rancida]|nr:hypothetical protein DXG01_001864 [Tephrocybe rancida]
MATTMHNAEHAESIAEVAERLSRGEHLDLPLPTICIACQKEQTSKSNRTYELNMVRASRGLHGSGSEFGWWTQAPCCGDHPKYMPGFQLLEEEHFGDEVGWKMAKDLIPWLDQAAFSKGLAKVPIAPPPSEQSWTKYHEWRNLPVNSLAVLLLHYPLSVYRLLHLLGLAHPAPSKKRHLKVHLLGVEEELDCLLITEGGWRRTIRMELSRSAAFYDDSHLSILLGEKPDALLSLNTGPTQSDSWRSVFLISRVLSIPCAITEYSDIELRTAVELMLRGLHVIQAIQWPNVRLSRAENHRIDQTRDDNFAIEVNPFMYPGPRPQSIYSGPTSLNAYTLIVTPGKPKLFP